jgi:spoIIIJ-associated protein
MSEDYGQRRRARTGATRRPAGGERRPPRPDRVPRPSPTYEPEPESAKPARELLEQILTKMGIAGVDVRYYARPEGEYFEIRGDDLANLIGRHGQTLEALNLVFNNALNTGVRKDRHYFTIDAEGYRARRADQLRGVALASLERAMREKRPIELEPMLPSERKVIHLALAENPYVTTESVGVDPDRRLVVTPRPG